MRVYNHWYINVIQTVNKQYTNLASFCVLTCRFRTIIDRCQTRQIKRLRTGHKQQNTHNTQHVPFYLTRCVFDLVSSCSLLSFNKTTTNCLGRNLNIDFDRSSTKCRSNMATITRHQNALWEGKWRFLSLCRVHKQPRKSIFQYSHFKRHMAPTHLIQETRLSCIFNIDSW